jgi:hypothetical protein
LHYNAIMVGLLWLGAGFLTWDLGPRGQDLGPGAWGLGPRTWDLGPGTWDLGPGTWDLGLGTWDWGFLCGVCGLEDSRLNLKPRRGDILTDRLKQVILAP